MKRINEEIMDIAEINRLLRESGKLKRISDKSTKQDKTLTKGAREFFTKNIKRMIPGGEGYRPAKRILKEVRKRMEGTPIQKKLGEKARDKAIYGLNRMRTKKRGDIATMSDDKLRKLYEDLTARGIRPKKLGMMRPDFFKKEIIRK